METEKETKTTIKVTDEPMTEEHRNVLRKARESLVKDMDPRNVLLKMARTNVFTEDQEDTIRRAGLTRQEQCEELLRILPTRGDRAYDIFKKALEKDHPHLAYEILKGENDELNLELTRERTNTARLRKRALGNQPCSRCHDLEKKLEALKKEMETDTRNNCLEQQVENLRKEKNEIESEKNKHKKEREIVEKEKTEIEFQLKKSQQELEKTKKHLDTENEKRVQAIRQREKFKTEYNILQKNLDKVKKKLEILEKAKPGSSSSQSSTGINALRKKMDDKQSKCNELEMEIRKYRRLLSKNQTQQDLDDKGESERKKPVKLKSKGDEERKTLEKEIREKETKIKKLEEANAKLKLYEPIIDDLEKQLKSQLREKETERAQAAQREKYLKEAVFRPRVFVPRMKSFYSHGVLHYLNRLSSAKLVATRSSDGPGNARDIFDGKKSTISGTEEEMNSWWCVDLGQHYLLAITHYALRHGNTEGESVLSQWKMEGSIDGLNFLEIETYEKMDNPPRYRGYDKHAPGRWSVNCEVGAFRYFRIFQTGRNSSNRYGIYLSGLELYGVLFKL